MIPVLPQCAGGINMSFESLPVFPDPEKISIKDVEGDIRVPYERVKSYDDKEFELFIREWVVSLKNKYQVRGFGGAGDKGRDVVARDESGDYFYYQCKHYDHPLRVSDILPEFGKLVYYTFIQEIPVPNEYYILAPWDIGAQLNDLIDKPSQINGIVIDKWDDSCRRRISNTPIDLSPDLELYIKDFDFSIIKTKTMLEVIEEHRSTAFYAFRFGGGLTVTRDKQIHPPETINDHETNYLRKYLAAISEKEKTPIATISELEQKFPKYMKSLKVQRERFYSAENLKAFASRHLLTDEYFKDLSSDIYYGIFDFFERRYSDGYERLNDVMTRVAQIDLQQNLLAKYGLLHTKDRQGICHQLANERGDIVWTNTD